MQPESGKDGNFVGNRGQSSFTNRRLTRQRKLRYVTDVELGLSTVDRPHSSTSPPGSSRKSRSATGPCHWSSAPLPEPLPLPELKFLRRPKSSGSNPGHGLGSPEETSCSAFGRTSPTHRASGNPSTQFPDNRSFQESHVVSVNNDFWPSMPVRSSPVVSPPFPSPVVSPPRSNGADRFPLHTAKSLTNRRWRFSDDLNVESANYNLRVNASPRSAPTSPAISSTRSKTADIFSSFWAPRKIEGWSTVEVPESGRSAGNTSPLSPVKRTVHSTGHSPLHSPSIQSLEIALRRDTKFSFPLHPKPHSQNSNDWPECSRVTAHPLPLPPGASPPPQSSMPAVMNHYTEMPTASLKGQWQKGKLIGRGTFGSVYIATNRVTGASCAMKEVDIISDDPKSAECIKQLQQEIRVLRQLQHQNIVQYYGSEVIDDHFYIYLEYVHPGSINKYVREHCGTITESIVRNFTRHILSGLAFLHSKKTIHRDIKGANLLVDAKGVVKLADFGMAKHLTGLTYELSMKGSPYWMAPEVHLVAVVCIFIDGLYLFYFTLVIVQVMLAVLQNKSNPDLALAVDIWSLGCTVIEMFTGKPPWSELEGPQAMFKVLHKSPPIPETLSYEGKDFLQCCLQREPAKRPSAIKLLDHPFVRNLNDQNVPVQAFSRLNLLGKSCSQVDSPTHKTDLTSNSLRTPIRNRKRTGHSETCQQCSPSFNWSPASHHSPRTTFRVNTFLPSAQLIHTSQSFSPPSNVSINVPLSAVNNHPCSFSRNHGREVPHI
ncbi:hypothetical protein Ddye_006935 [Dipteronia dyeriana]|uniref:mitogen-activated protein kinase kinase kinase n=1 Tax=Dipteronia dyeriana TaxID=168575 RepID=A0AAE0CR55_9ROSI|nr:hypothetical protein Ddye_006935 [Dipteronia dyeriana]